MARVALLLTVCVLLAFEAQSQAFTTDSPCPARAAAAATPRCPPGTAPAHRAAPAAAGSSGTCCDVEADACGAEVGGCGRGWSLQPAGTSEWFALGAFSRREWYLFQK